jgi:hypothetical protein
MPLAPTDAPADLALLASPFRKHPLHFLVNRCESR